MPDSVLPSKFDATQESASSSEESPFRTPSGARPRSSGFLRRLTSDRARMALRRSRAWLLLAPGLCAAAAGLWAYLATPYGARARIAPNESSRAIAANLPLRAQQAALEPDHVAARILETGGPSAARIAVRVAPGQSQVEITALHATAATAVEAANQAAHRATADLAAVQSNSWRNAARALETQVAEIDSELTEINEQLIRFQRAAGAVDFEKDTPAHLQQWVELENRRQSLTHRLETLDLQSASLLAEVSRHSPELHAAREALQKARLLYTEEHPKVRELRAAVQTLEEQLTRPPAGPNTNLTAPADSVAASILLQIIELRKNRIAVARELEEVDAARAALGDQLGALPEKQVAYARLKSKYDALRANRSNLDSERQTLELLLQSPTPPYTVLALALPTTLSATGKIRAGIGAAGMAGAAALLLALGTVLLVDVLDRRIRTAADLESATQLPVLATLGELKSMRKAERESWAFHTFAALRALAGAGAGQSLVCGFTSSAAGEGRSTWIRLLAETAAHQGYRVLTLCAAKSRHRTLLPPRGARPAAPPPPATAAEPTAALASAFESATTLVAQGDNPIVHLPLSSWVWNIEQRQQWNRAFAQWQATPNLVVLVELPPATLRETYLLAESIPQVIWLSAKDTATADQTRAQLRTLRGSNVRLAGAVLNRAAAFA